MTVFIQSYDEKGNLLGHSEPLMYCGETNSYDSLNRLTQSEVMCGESSGNGTYYFTYTGNTRVETFEGVVWNSKITTTYENGRIVEIRHVQTSLDNAVFNTVSTSRYNYFFNAKGLLKEEEIDETGIYEDFSGSTPYVDTTASKIVIEYSYTSFDSLAKKVKKTGNGVEETTQYSYDENTHLPTHVFYSRGNPAVPNDQNYRDSYLHDQYIYDKNGKLTKHLQFGYTQDHAEQHKNDPKVPDLIEEYEDGLLIRSTVTQYKNESVTFSYELWD